MGENRVHTCEETKLLLKPVRWAQPVGKLVGRATPVSPCAAHLTENEQQLTGDVLLKCRLRTLHTETNCGKERAQFMGKNYKDRLRGHPLIT